MSLNLNNQKRGGGGDGTKQPILEVGTVPARLVRVIDLGVQARPAFNGQEKPPAHMVDFTYELLDVFMVDKDGKEIEDKPRWISEQFAIMHPSADLATSTKRVKALDPENRFDYDLTKLIGQPCMVTIGHKQSKGKTFANVIGVTPMRAKDAEKAPGLKNDPIVFSLDEPDLETFNKFPEWLQEKIKSNLEYKGSKLQKLLEGEGAPDEDGDNNDWDNPEEESESW